MKAGHYENRKESVDIMIRNSRDIINDLVKYGVEFEKKDGKFAYTREGAHSRPRILFHEDVTGKEITSKLLAQVKKLENVKIYEYTKMTDVIIENGNVWESKQRMKTEHTKSMRRIQSCKRRNRWNLPAFDKFSTSDRRCD